MFFKKKMRWLQLCVRLNVVNERLTVVFIRVFEHKLFWKEWFIRVYFIVLFGCFSRVTQSYIFNSKLGLIKVSDIRNERILIFKYKLKEFLKLSKIQFLLFGIVFAFIEFYSNDSHENVFKNFINGFSSYCFSDYFTKSNSN